MRVFGSGVSTDPKRPGLFLRGGDVCDPKDGDWFKPPWPKIVVRRWVPNPTLPFLCLKIGRFGFYVGWKVYGVDAPEYKNWLPPEEVYVGSLALCLTARTFTDA